MKKVLNFLIAFLHLALMPVWVLCYLLGVIWWAAVDCFDTGYDHADDVWTVEEENTTTTKQGELN